MGGCGVWVVAHWSVGCWWQEGQQRCYPHRNAPHPLSECHLLLKCAEMKVSLSGLPACCGRFQHPACWTAPDSLTTPADCSMGAVCSRCSLHSSLSDIHTLFAFSDEAFCFSSWQVIGVPREHLQWCTEMWSFLMEWQDCREWICCSNVTYKLLEQSRFKRKPFLKVHDNHF